MRFCSSRCGIRDLLLFLVILVNVGCILTDSSDEFLVLMLNRSRLCYMELSRGF